MNLHRDTEYALICLSEMKDRDRVYSARSLAESSNLPYELLCKILQRLSNAGILQSVRGPRGGYSLTTGPDEISLSSVISAVHGTPKVVPCIDSMGCERGGSCTIRGGVMRIQSMWERMMDEISLEQFIRGKDPVPQGSSK